MKALVGAPNEEKALKFANLYFKTHSLPRVFTTALATASPSPSAVMEAWEPPLKAKNPKMRMNAPSATRGTEWAIIPTWPCTLELSTYLREVFTVPREDPYGDSRIPSL